MNGLTKKFIIIIGVALSIFGYIAVQNMNLRKESIIVNAPLGIISQKEEKENLVSGLIDNSSNGVISETSTGIVSNFDENKLAFKKDIESIKNLLIYDGRTNKNKGLEIQQYFDNNFSIKIGAINSVGIYQTTFIGGNDKKSLKTLKKWFFGIYQDDIDLPNGVTAIIIGDNREDILPKLLLKSLNGNK